MATDATLSANDLSTAQSQTYAMLLNMGFDEPNSISAAKIFGADVNSAVNYLASDPVMPSYDSQPPPQSASTFTTSLHENHHNNIHKESNNHPKHKHKKDRKSKLRKMSPDDLCVQQFLIAIGDEMDRTLFEEEVIETTAQILKESSDQEYSSQAYVPKSKEEEEFDAKTNETIKQHTSLSISHEIILNDAMIGKAVWFGDVISLRQFPKELMDVLDHHGNTPLALACRLGHDNVSHALLEMEADPCVELGCGWNVIQEAVLNQDHRLVRDLLIYQIQRRGSAYEARNKEIIAHLKTMPDFQIEISWKIQSTLAVLNTLIDKFAKIDNFKIWKKGSNIRFDMYMRGFSAQGVEKGHISFVFTEGQITSIDHDRKTFMNAIRKYKNPDFDEMEREIRILMRTEQGRASLKTKNVEFVRKKGWMGGDKTEQIENYQCDVMCTKNLAHVIIEGAKKDWQHPSFEEYFKGTFGENDSNKKNDKNKKNGKKKRKFSLTKHSQHKTDKKFVPSYIHKKEQPVDVTLWLCKEYPLTDDNISILLEAISIASEDMRKLSDIFKLKFPGGFPIKLTMPIVVGISASATFCNFRRANISDSVFAVPSHYRIQM